MARNKKYQTTKKSDIEESLENIEESLTKTERFIENNQKSIIMAVLVTTAIVLGYFGFTKLYKAPHENKAMEAMYQAQEAFQKNDYKAALEGVKKVGKKTIGFLEVISEYGSTKAGNLAQYYAGICYKNLGEFEKAISYLKEFSSEDYFLQAIAYSSQGDCNFELGKFAEAAALYEKATKVNPNNFSTPIFYQRQGLALEKAKEFEKAVKVYTELKDKYPFSMEGREIDKYIVRAKAALKK